MKYNNPHIKVTWEDIPENFTQERIKRVKSYFQNKYNSRNITVLTKSVDRNDNGELDIDIEQNVMDTNYQKNLMTQFVENNNMDVDINLLKRLDEKVNGKMSEEMSINTHYKRVYVKKIKFSNFLSFGDNNNLDVNSLGGITVIDSNPPNFGGKSVLAVDLILFLFFKLFLLLLITFSGSKLELLVLIISLSLFESLEINNNNDINLNYYILCV